MTHVTRYLLVSRVERETNNELKPSLLGSDRQSGSYKPMESRGGSYTLRATSLSLRRPAFSDILCCLGVMFTSKESEMRSSKRFPSQQKSSESVK